MDDDAELTGRAAADAAFHDATAHLYDDTLGPISRVRIGLMVEPWVRSLPGSGSALDVGCGTGAMAAHLAKRGYAVSGIDRSAGMLDVARRTLGDAAELTNGDVHDRPYPDRSFDVVAQKALVSATSWPWRNRSGNMVAITCRVVA
jgi:SAM-dependent methyltransferase